MKYLILLILLILLYIFSSCNEKPKIPISNNLELNLGSKYPHYVNLLNKAFDKDTTALFDFFKINVIYDAASYDHGFVLTELLKINGDQRISSVLKKIEVKELSTIKQYFRAGMDANDSYQIELIKNYPLTFTLLDMHAPPITRIHQ